MPEALPLWQMAATAFYLMLAIPVVLVVTVALMPFVVSWRPLKRVACWRCGGFIDPAARICFHCAQPVKV
jgi:hypothetical protein